MFIVIVAAGRWCKTQKQACHNERDLITWESKKLIGFVVERCCR